jgi:anti-sigma factor RsiW
MQCEDIQPLLDAYIDQELDLVYDIEVATHLQRCQECTRQSEALRALQTMLRTRGTYYVPPAPVRRRLRLALRRVSPRPLGWRLWLLGAAAVVLVVLAGSNMTHWTPAHTAVAEPAVREVVAAHIRSLQVDHLIDIVSNDTHTVKPWFSDKLPFAPSVRDLAAHDFVLVGARLDYLSERPVAAVVYRRRRHLINVFLAPATPDLTGPTTPVAYRGYHLLHWHHNGLTHWVVSDLNQRELGLLMHLLREQGGV